MSQGQQIIAPKGFRTLQAGTRYHVVHQDDVEGRVTLAFFSSKGRVAHLTHLEADRYDQAKTSGLIRVLQGRDVERLPHWLKSREHEPFDASPRVWAADPSAGDGKGLTDWQVVQRREDLIQDAVDAYEEIFSQPDPIAALNRRARAKGQNEARFRLWVITYLAFGQNRWVLLPPPGGRGTYDREVLAAMDVKTGRPCHVGRFNGAGVTRQAKDLMVKGFRRFAAKGKSLADIHAQTAEELFQAKYETVDDRTVIVQIDPKLPFPPTYGQFRHWVVKLLTHKVVWSKLLGDQAYRQRFEAPDGSYFERLSDLLERVMSDATAADTLPKSYLSEEPGLPLYQVEACDMLSGMGIGIAFGIGSERESLYRQCMASIALPKSMLGRVFGVPVKDEDYPVSGVMPSAAQTDRGKGAARKIKQLNKEFGISPEQAPSYTPQSQGFIEASHPTRTVRTGGAPIHKVSDLNAFQMSQHRFIEFLARNRSKSIVNRLTPELLAKGIQCPLEYWKELLKEGRIRGTPVKPIDVITGYLPQVTFEVKEGRLCRDGVVYRPARSIGDVDRALSAREVKTLNQQIFNSKDKQFSGFKFEISNIVEWVVIGKQLIEVHVVSRVMEHLDRVSMTHVESAAHAEMALGNATASKQIQSAERIRKRIDAREQTGKPFMSSRVKSGRSPAKTTAARQEAAATKLD